MRELVLIFVLLIAVKNLHGQEVLVFEDFESVPVGWSNSTKVGPDNEWYRLNTNSVFTAGSYCYGVSSDGFNNTYNNITSDHSVWTQISWPASITTYDVDLQFDTRVGGVPLSDFLEVFLVDLDPNITEPIAANLNATNSVSLGIYLSIGTWGRIPLSLSPAEKTFIENATNDVSLVFNWTNSAIVPVNPSAAIDNVIVTATPASALSGDYTVGKIAGNNFATLSDAVDCLNNSGLSGDVNFYLTDEAYDSDFESFPFEIGDGSATPFPGAGTYNILIKPDVVLQPTPTITADNLIGVNHGVITIWGVNNVTVDGSNTVGGTTRDLTIINEEIGTVGNAPLGVFISSIDESTAVNNIDVKNTNIEILSSFGYGLVGGIHRLDLTDHWRDEGNLNDIVIENNNFSGGLEAIHIDGVDRILTPVFSYGSSALATNILIKGNDINDNTKPVLENGIHILGVNGCDIVQNDIGYINSTDLHQDVGIVIDRNSRNLTVEKNEIHDLGFSGDLVSSFSSHGIDVYSGLSNSDITIRNNVIRGIAGNGAGSFANAGYYNPVAIFLGLGGEVGVTLLGSQSGIKVYNNSINLFGDEMQFLTSVSIGMAVASNTTDVYFKNNVIKNTLGATNTLIGKASALAVYTESVVTPFSDIDFNAYYVNADEAYTNNYVGLSGLLSSILSATLDLFSWRSGIGGEVNSIFADPGYTSDINLVPNTSNAKSWNIHGMGDFISISASGSVNARVMAVNGLVDDKNGVTRPASVEQGSVDMGAFEFNNDPAITPPEVFALNGPFTPGTPYPISVNQKELTVITFNPGSDLPSDLTLQYFSGVWPDDESEFSISNFYFDLGTNDVPTDNYDFDLQYNYSENQLGTVADENSVDVALSYNQLAAVWEAQPSVVNTTNNSLVANVSRFGRYTMTANPSPLPVEFMNPHAYASGSFNVIEWSTLTEYSSNNFSIEKSEDMVNWYSFGDLPAAGFSNVQKDYSVKDSNPFNITYYRIVEYNYDNEESLSKVLKVVRDDRMDISFSPNPVDDYMIIKINSGGLNHMGIKTVEGKSIYNKGLEDAISEEVVLDLRDLKRGVYFLHCETGHGSKVFKFLKK